MGYIKEPAGVDFFVDPKPLTTADRKRISEIIAYYKATGRKMPMKKQKFAQQTGETKKLYPDYPHHQKVVTLDLLRETRLGR